MDLRALPGTALDRVLSLYRVPLTVAERVVGQQHDPDQPATWPPAIAYERVEAAIRQLAGTIWRDERLLERARLQRAKADELERAGVLELDAARRREESEQRRQSRQEQADEQRRRAQADADRQRAEVEGTAEELEEQVAADLDKRRSETARKAADQRRRQRQQNAAQRLDELTAEERALAHEESTLEAKRRALRLEDEAKAQKAVRRAKARAATR